MAISTYAELQTALTNWTQRSDLSSRNPEFIALAEAAFNRGFDPERPFRHFSQEASTTLSATTTVGIGSGYSLPTDFQELRDVQTTTTPYVRLQYIAPEAGDQLYNTTTTGIPRFFTLQAGYLRVYPVPSSGYSVQITYYQTIPALTNSNTTNWLLTNHPDVYLFGALLHASVFFNDDVAVQRIAAGWQTAVNSLRSATQRTRFGGGALQVVAA